MLLYKKKNNKLPSFSLMFGKFSFLKQKMCKILFFRLRMFSFENVLFEGGIFIKEIFWRKILKMYFLREQFFKTIFFFKYIFWGSNFFLKKSFKMYFFRQQFFKQFWGINFWKCLCEDLSWLLIGMSNTFCCFKVLICQSLHRK